MDSTSQVGIEETDDGWVFAGLRDPIRLSPDTVYLLASSELADTDSFYDKGVRVTLDDDITVKGPVYLDASGWHQYEEPNQVFGPLNAWLEAASDAPLTPFGKAKVPAPNATSAASGFKLGQKVQRRDEGKAWDTGYVVSVNPLLVTVHDRADAHGYKWREVRQIPAAPEVSTSDTHAFLQRAPA
jgi:hypothetical protein